MAVEDIEDNVEDDDIENLLDEDEDEDEEIEDEDDKEVE